MKTKMKKLLFSLCLLVSVVTQAQTITATRVYQVAGQIIIGDSSGTRLTPYSAQNSSVTPFLTNRILVRFGNDQAVYLTPSTFLNASGVPYSTASVAAAITAYVNSIPVSAGAGAAPSVTFGSTPPILTDYTGDSGSIPLTNVIRVFVENVGEANGTLTFGAGSWTILPGDAREFNAIIDPITNRITPFLPISLNGTGTKMRLIRYFKQ